MIRPREWQGLVRGLGESFVELAAAEFEALGQEFSSHGRSLGIALGLAGAAAFLGFWTIGLATAAVVAILAIWVPVWAAALITLGVFCLKGLILGWLALRRLKRLQAPTVTVRNRWEDHLDWWKTVRGALGETPDAIEPSRRREHLGGGSKKGSDEMGDDS